MLLRIRDLRGDRIHAEDGEVGSVGELYFDDQAWDVRYLAVDTRRWMPGRKYFISPVAIGRSRRFATRGDIRVELTRDQISRCPTAPQANLRSCTEVLGCGGIEARDGVIGISPEVIERIDWREKTMHVSLAREDILQAPEVRL